MAAPAWAWPSAANLSNLLGGEIQLRSTPGVGSTFKLYLPLRYVGAATAGPAGATPGAAATGRAARARRSSRSRTTAADLAPGDTVLLIVEDDPHYARILMDLAHDEGFKVLVASRGDDALELAEEYQPAAVSLDIFLPDMLGWTVLSQLKQNPPRPATFRSRSSPWTRTASTAWRAAPSPSSPSRPRPKACRIALSKIKAYVQPRRKRLLVVEDNPAEQISIAALLGHDDIEIVSAGTGAEALEIAARRAGGLRGARSAAARYFRLRAAGADSATIRPWPIFR